jgi:corrinoid protein of di/trimethylamine methyltransferase
MTNLSNEEIFKRLSDAVLEMDEEGTVKLAEDSVELGIEAYETIDKGLVSGMMRAGDLFESEEYFIPELLLCSDAMYAGLSVLQPHLAKQDRNLKSRIIIGVIEGDTHDIGKNLVKIMLETSGFEVIDLGRDISPRSFTEEAYRAQARIIALSTLMTTTMDGMAEVVRILEQDKRRDRHSVIVGGGPVSSAFAGRIGADGYAPNASDAVRLVKSLTGGIPVCSKIG